MGKMNSDANMPIAITLEAGTYFRCTCGRSQDLPFCDGAHSRGDELPIRFELTEKKKVYICSCGKSKSQPFCDQTCGVELPE
jgi:CDGSH-type Zn-finger protein